MNWLEEVSCDGEQLFMMVSSSRKKNNPGVLRSTLGTLSPEDGLLTKIKVNFGATS